MKRVLICWRKISRRSQLLSEKWGINIIFFKGRIPYIEEAIRTIIFIGSKKPDTVIVQLPQGPLLLSALIGKIFSRSTKIIADCHTGFLYPVHPKEKILNLPFRFLIRFVDEIWVHNSAILEIIPRQLRKKVKVVIDPRPFDKVGIPKAADKIIFVYPCTWTYDDPWPYIIALFKALSKLRKDFILYITGRYPSCVGKIVRGSRIVLTGWLSWEEYVKLLKSAHVILGLTKREYTFVHAAWEGYCLGKLIILSPTKTLRKIYSKELKYNKVDYLSYNIHSDIKLLEKIIDNLKKS